MAHCSIILRVVSEFEQLAKIAASYTQGRIQGWLNKVGALVETNQLIYHQLLYNLVLSVMSITTLPFFRATLALSAACA